jgi:cell division septum initiation protein DivIVA
MRRVKLADVDAYIEWLENRLEETESELERLRAQQIRELGERLKEGDRLHNRLLIAMVGGDSKAAAEAIVKAEATEERG